MNPTHESHWKSSNSTRFPLGFYSNAFWCFLYNRFLSKLLCKNSTERGRTFWVYLANSRSFAWKPIVHHWLPQWFPHCLANAHLCCKVDTALQKLWGQYLPKQYLSKTLHIFSCTPKRTIKTNTRLIAIPLLITKQPTCVWAGMKRHTFDVFQVACKYAPRHDLHGLLNKYRIHDIPENLWGDEARAPPRCGL